MTDRALKTGKNMWDILFGNADPVFVFKLDSVCLLYGYRKKGINRTDIAYAYEMFRDIFEEMHFSKKKNIE